MWFTLHVYHRTERFHLPLHKPVIFTIFGIGIGIAPIPDLNL